MNEYREKSDLPRCEGSDSHKWANKMEVQRFFSGYMDNTRLNEKITRKTILRVVVLYSILSLMLSGTSFASFSGKLISADYNPEVMQGVDDLNITVNVQNTGTETWPYGGSPSWMCKLIWKEGTTNIISGRSVFTTILPGENTEVTVTLDEEDIPDVPGTYSYVKLYAYCPESIYPQDYINMTNSPLPITFTVIGISKCNVKAGKSIGQDTISFSGKFDATENDLLNANQDQVLMNNGLITTSQAKVLVNIDADDIPSPLNFIFPINNVFFKNGIYNCARTVNEATSFFKFDPRNGKVIFNAKKKDLTGLACPITITVAIGSYSTTLQLDENIVNGSKKPCPPQLLMGVKDSLTVDKAKVRFGKKPDTDSLSVRGFFTINGMNYDKSNPLVIFLGSQTFTIPGSQIIMKKTIERCSKVPVDEGGYVSVKFDFSKCKYSIAIKKADITESGTVDFGIQLFDKALLDFAHLDL